MLRACTAHGQDPFRGQDLKPRGKRLGNAGHPDATNPAPGTPFEHVGGQAACERCPRSRIRGVDRLSAVINRRALDAPRGDASAHAAPLVEHKHRKSCRRERARGGQPGDTSADHSDIAASIVRPARGDLRNFRGLQGFIGFANENVLHSNTHPFTSWHPMTVTLDQLRVGESARVAGYRATSAYAAQLMRLGLTPGTLLRVQRVAPLGDPIEIRIRGFSLVLRPSEADCLELSRV